MANIKVPTNATQYCQLVESRLGWEPPPGAPHRRYQGMANRVNTRIEETGYTFTDLALAVALCQKEKLPRNPLGVFAFVPRAREMAVEPGGELDQHIREAIAYEIGRGDPAGWAVRLTRAQGVFRGQALAEWRESVR